MPTLCPVCEKKIHLRPSCSTCNGRPANQLNIQRHSTLYLEGDVADAVFTAVDGFLQETRALPDGRTQGIRLIKPGDLIGTEALSHGVYQGTVEAVTHARVCRVPVQAVLDRIRGTPEQGVAVVKALSEEATSLRRSVLLVGAMTAEERVRALLLDLTDRAEPGSWTRLPITRQELADLVGLAPATVSRVVQRLARAGLVTVRGRWICKGVPTRPIPRSSSAAARS
ncbi:MAG: Crp/Fnr family transcriptional regulator [Myxococcota bacterium]